LLSDLNNDLNNGGLTQSAKQHAAA